MAKNKKGPHPIRKGPPKTQKITEEDINYETRIEQAKFFHQVVISSFLISFHPIHKNKIYRSCPDVARNV
jgi:hypothetical protein